MRNRRIALAVLLSLLWLAGCQSKTSESQTDQKSEASQPQPQPQSQPQPAASTAPSPSPAPAEKPETKGQSASPPPSAKQAPKPPSQPILLTGAPMGGVRFQHAKHPLPCDTCHHPARQPKPGSAPQQACTSCHTVPPQSGMKTGKQAAFHNPTATAGTCIDCHKKSGGSAPTKCLQCHKKENA